MTWQVDVGSTTVDMAGTWANQQLTRGMFWLVVKMPRGPVVGCHVAPHNWFVGYIKFWYVAGGRTRDLPTGESTGRVRLASPPSGGACKPFDIKFI
jgi:hypothetical protein